MMSMNISSLCSINRILQNNGLLLLLQLLLKLWSKLEINFSFMRFLYCHLLKVLWAASLSIDRWDCLDTLTCNWSFSGYRTGLSWWVSSCWFIIDRLLTCSLLSSMACTGGSLLRLLLTNLRLAFRSIGWANTNYLNEVMIMIVYVNWGDLLPFNIHRRIVDLTWGFYL